MTKVQLMKGLQVAYAKPADLKPQPVPVNVTLVKAGETEFLTSDGYRVTLRIKNIKLFRTGTQPDGMPIYQNDLEIIPTIVPILNAGGREIGELEN